MGLLGKILTVISCVIGIVCCCFTLGANNYVFKHSEILGSNLKAYVACTFIALFIFIAAAILIFFTFCCPCTDIVGGIFGVVAGALTLFFLAVAYACFHEGHRLGNAGVPRSSEWLFGGIVAGAELILVSLTLALG